MTTPPRRLGFSAMLLFALVAIAMDGLKPAAAVENAPAAPALFVVFDSSGSMWGELDRGGGAKFETAREALRTAIPENAAGRGGLIVFGPGCNQGDFAVPPRSGPLQQILTPLARLNPRGRGPITLALQQAAAAIGPEEAASILLIHDGADNCRQDPCALAEDLAREKPRLQVHLVSLGLDTADARATSCIAKATGGRQFLAATAGEAREAVQSAVQLALNAAPLAPTDALEEQAAVAPEAPAGPAPEFDPDGPPHLVVSARLGSSDLVPPAQVRWLLYRADAVATPVLDVVEQRFAVPVEAGTYIIEGRLGKAQARQSIVVGPKGATLAEVRFEAGLLEVATGAAATLGGPSPILTVRRAAEDGSTADVIATPLLITKLRREAIVLPAGSYDVSVQAGTFSVDRRVEIPEGARVQADLPLAIGRLDVTAVDANGSPLDAGHDFTVMVSVDDPDAAGGRREIARSAAARMRLPVQPGTYYVRIQSGLAVTSDRIAVGAGDEVSRAIPLQVGRVRITASASLSDFETDLPVLYRVYDLQQSAREVVMSGARTASLALPPGRYRLVAEIGARNVSAERQIKLEAGQKLDIDIQAAAGKLQLRLADSVGGLVTDRFWEVRDATGKLVWRTSHHAPSALLSPGRYTVRCETRGQVLERSFEVAAGSQQSVILGAP